MLSARDKPIDITYLEDHAGGDDRGDTQFHQSTTVTGQHHTEPVQGVRGVGGDDTIERHLAHDQEDKQSQLYTRLRSALNTDHETRSILEVGATYTRPHQLLVEGHLGLRRRHLRKEGREGLDQVKEAN